MYSEFDRFLFLHRTDFFTPSGVRVNEPVKSVMLCPYSPPDTKEEDMINYHFNIGMELRNHYKLWESKIKQLDEFGFEVHPDDISFEFIKEAQRQINDIQVG